MSTDYTDDHEWVQVEGGIVTIGITAHAAEQLGEITEVNGALAANSALVNESAEDEAWLCRIKLADPPQLDGLMDRAAYDASIAD